MREIRQSGSEGGAVQANAPFLPLSEKVRSGIVISCLAPDGCVPSPSPLVAPVRRNVMPANAGIQGSS